MPCRVRFKVLNFFGMLKKTGDGLTKMYKHFKMEELLDTTTHGLFNPVIKTIMGINGWEL